MKIAIVHGRQQEAKRILEEAVEFLGHTPMFFDDTKLSVAGLTFNFEICRRLIEDADHVLVALTPDEEAILVQALRQNNSDDWQTMPRVRPNVALELGMAAALKPDKTTVVSFGMPFDAVPSDLFGLNAFEYHNATNLMKTLATRLESCEVAYPIPSDFSPPWPDFDTAQPPYDFISTATALRLPQSEITLGFTEERGAHESHGYEVKSTYPQREGWQREGWKPYVHKDINLREFVWPWHDTGLPNDRRPYVIRKKQS